MRKSKTPSALVRAALVQAEGAERPDVERLVAAVPALMSEARRRRAEPPGGVATVAARAWGALPRLAAVTAAALLLASIVVLVERARTGSDVPSLESVIFSGESDDAGDVLLDAVLVADAGDG